MRVIFLDIDGVLNCSETPNPRNFPYVVDAKLLKRLKRLLEEAAVQVVLSSSWRVDPVGLLGAKYFEVPFIDVCPDMPSEQRCVEMRVWLLEHPQVTRYAIIDDEDDGLDDMRCFSHQAKPGSTARLQKACAATSQEKPTRPCATMCSCASDRTFTHCLSATKVSRGCAQREAPFPRCDRPEVHRR